MKRLLLIGAIAVGAWFSIGAIGDATQTREDVRHADRATEVVIHVEGLRYRQSLDVAANALYSTCTATVSGRLVEPGIVDLGGGDYSFAMTPSLGHHGKERLLGCLRDLTIERVKSSVVSIEEIAYRPAA